VNPNLRVFLEDVQESVLGGFEVLPRGLGEVILCDLFDNRVEVGLVESHEINNPIVSYCRISGG
jgi:hypothetical protein